MLRMRTRPSQEGLLRFTVPPELKEVAGRVQRSDPYEVRREIKVKQVERATVSKTVARSMLGSRLLRFGDPVFDAMVRHVQDSDFSDGVASLQLPASVVGWPAGAQGTPVVFDLKVIRQEGSVGGARVLREHLAAIAVQHGEAPHEAEHLLENLHDALSGGLTIDVAEVKRAYDVAKVAVDSRLSSLYRECIAEYGSSDAIVPQSEDFAIAWVEAVDVG